MERGPFIHQFMILKGIMSNINSILNPDGNRKRVVKLVLNMKNRERALSATPPSPTMSPVNAHAELKGTSCNDRKTENEDRKYHDHEMHPDCPDTLACLPDTDGRPQHTLPVILRCAILGSPRKRLTIREIYAAMEAKYPYYKQAGPTWKQSVRHHLSLNRLFERQPRPVTDPGFGSYWTVNLAAPPGTKRPRKRGRSGNKGTARGVLDVPRKRGRPKKELTTFSIREPTPIPSSPESHEDEEEEEEEEGKFSFDEEALKVSDEYESEEELVNPHDRRNSLIGISAYAPSKPPQPFTLPPFSSLDHGSENLVERLQLEIENLRRQSAESVSVSLRLSEQVSQAQAEVSRLRETLRDVEDLLERESRKRREAERTAEEETKRRRSAEEALRVMTVASSRSRPS